MSQLAIDHQLVKQRCEHCGVEFAVSRGSVYEDGIGVGIYLVAMHTCHSGQLVNLAIGYARHSRGVMDVCSIAMRIWPTETEFQMKVVNWEESPWQYEAYLYNKLDREQALKSPLIQTFFHIADHIVSENPDVYCYLMVG